MLSNKNNKAVIYLRSSKDRSDVSISSQERELKRLAKDKGLTIIERYADTVESAKDERRPDFQRLLRDMKAPSREWQHLLMLDTSRLSRRKYFAPIFKHECEKLGIAIHYAKFPDVDPVSKVILEAVLEAMDVVHSMMSREKGLAGMAENVEQGFRAGGRAPRGYKLKKIPTGAMRDGEPVTKSVLELSDEAPIIKRYLQGRIAGESRRVLKKELELTLAETTLIGIEWNALTYAGHTVWNVHNEFKKGEGYHGGTKRRPREDWKIKRDTHDALITEEEAELLIANLEQKRNLRKPRTANLLTGILKTPDGNNWHSDGCGFYRGGGKKIGMERLETAVVDCVIGDMKSDRFVKMIHQEMQAFINQHQIDPAADLRQALKDISQQIDRNLENAERLSDPDPALRRVDQLEQKRKATAAEIDRLEREYHAANILQAITRRDITAMLDSVANEVSEMKKDSLKAILHSLIERIELNPADLACTVRYALDLSAGDWMASPRACEAIPRVVVETTLKMA